MKRRTSSRAVNLPLQLRVFVSSEWSGRDESERYGEWMEAREDWKDERNIAWLPDDDAAHAAFPDGEWREEDI